MHIKDKIKAKQDEWRQRQADQQAERHCKVAHKRLQQRRKGHPSDKSPV